MTETGFVRALLARPFARDVALSYVFTVASLVANLLTGIIIARTLGAAGRGELAAILAFTQVATWIFAMGCNQAASFHLARHPTDGARIIGTWLLLLAPFAVLGVAASIAVLPIALGAQRDAVVILGQLFATTLILALAMELLQGVILGDHRFLQWNLLRFAQPTGVAVIYAVLLVLDALTVTSALVANGGMVALILVVSGAGLLRRHGRPRVDRRLARSTFSYGFRVHGSNVAGTVNARLDLAIIPAFLGAASVGLYSVATNVAAIVGTLAGSIVALVLPAAARRADRGPATVVASMYIAFGIGALGALVIGALAEPTLRLLYGAEFEAASGPLRVLLVGYVLLMPGLVLSQGLSAVDRPFTGTIPHLAGAAVTVVGLLLFLSGGGIMAAAWITTAAYAVVVVSALVLYRSVTRLPWRALSPARTLSDLRSHTVPRADQP